MQHLKIIALTILAVFAPIKAILITTLVLVLLDFILGVWAAKKRGEIITSAGMRRSVSKLVIYEICLMLAFLCENFMTGGLLPLTKIASTFIAMVELKSNLESLNTISGTDMLSALIKKLGSANDGV